MILYPAIWLSMKRYELDSKDIKSIYIYELYFSTTNLSLTLNKFPKNKQKIGNRLYKFGSYNLEIPKKVLDKLSEWNQRSDKNTADFDKRFVNALLLLCVELKETTIDSISPHVLQFINGSFGLFSIIFKSTEFK